MYLFVCLFLAASGLSCGMGDLCCSIWDLSLQPSGFFLVEGPRFSVVVVRGLSCPMACGILVPQPGIEPMPPALEGGFLVTGPPWSLQDGLFLIKFEFQVNMDLEIEL